MSSFPIQTAGLDLQETLGHRQGLTNGDSSRSGAARRRRSRVSRRPAASGATTRATVGRACGCCSHSLAVLTGRHPVPPARCRTTDRRWPASAGWVARPGPSSRIRTRFASGQLSARLARSRRDSGTFQDRIHVNGHPDPKRAGGNLSTAARHWCERVSRHVVSRARCCVGGRGVQRRAD